MKVTSAEFLKSVLDPDQYPKDRKPEFAFIGRSNVGKSSLLNTLLAKPGLAKTSGTPGKTQTLNFFTVNGSFYFVDLPGYGFAKVPKALKDQWNIVMRAYLEAREPLRLAVLLLDSRHLPNLNDLHMLELLEEAAVPTVLVATKVDKLGRNERSKNLAALRKVLELEPDAALVPFSSETREGMKELWGIIEDLLAAKTPEQS